MKLFNTFFVGLFCILLVSCGKILERRNVKIELISESETEIVFNAQCIDNKLGLDNLDVSYPNDSTALINAIARSAKAGNLKNDFVIKVKNNPNLRFVLFGTKKHIIWIKNK